MSHAVDLAAARAFLAGHGRLLERQRFELLLGAGAEMADRVLAALDCYRNPDGGYGWGLEPDLRSPGSQPSCGMHAFEILAEVASRSPRSVITSSRAVELCDWMGKHTLTDGGLPFTLPVADPAACSPVWLGEDHTTSSLQMTAQVAATAHLVARHDQRVADHPWLARASAWCVDAIGRLGASPPAHELLFAVRFVDAYAAANSAGAELLARLGPYIPADGVVRVEGGAEDEALRPLDIAPRVGAARRLFTDDVIAADLDRLAQGQQPDGGWTVDFAASSPAAAIEWRGIATLDALATLLDADEIVALDDRTCPPGCGVVAGAADDDAGSPSSSMWRW